MDTILVANAGSSSVKFQLFGTDGAGDLNRLIKGQMDGIGTRPRLRAAASDGRPLIDDTYPVQDVPDLPAAMQKTGTWLRVPQNLNPVAAGPPLLHPGPDSDPPLGAA